MPIRPSVLFATVVAGAVLIGNAGCERAKQTAEELGGRQINIMFSSADNVKGGEAVYLAGQRIGTTAGTAIVSGKARVSVRLTRKNSQAPSPRTVFLLKDDPNNPQRKCIVGLALDAGASLPTVQKDTYQGASNLVELAGIVGVEYAKDLWTKLKDWAPSPLETD